MLNEISFTGDKVLIDGYKHIDLPIGTIIMNAGNNGGTSFGNAFLLCNGSSQSIASYPELHAIIGTKYGTSGAGSFHVPNFTQRFPMGLQSVGATGLTNVDPFANLLARQGGNLEIQSNQFVHRHLSVTPSIRGVASINTQGNMDNDQQPITIRTFIRSAPLDNIPIVETNAPPHLPPYYTLNYFIYTGKGTIG